MKAPPPTRIKIRDLPLHIKMRYGRKVSFKTCYNWCVLGYKNESLQWTAMPKKSFPNPYFPDVQTFPYGRKTCMTTTDKWVDEFIQRTGMFR